VRWIVAVLLALFFVTGSPSMAQTQPARPAAGAPTAHGFGFDGLSGGRIDLSAWRGRPVLVVNTASECGFTSQYRGLQALWERYRARGLVVLGVPSNDFGGQEPGSARQIATFCEINYGVTFPLAAKSAVTGTAAHPFYRWAARAGGAGAVPRWNFHKILIGADGQVRATFPSATDPNDPALIRAVEAALPPARSPARR
jgi:glutathione peroxidase